MNELQKPRSVSFVRRVVRKVTVLSIIFIAGLIVMSMTAGRPSHLGLHGEKLAPVPDSPNCVSSMTDKEAFSIDPIDVRGVEEPVEKLKKAIAASMPRARLVSDKGDYLHYEFTSFLFRFVDDTEFLLDADDEVIHVRSASRVGYSDMGANRNRVEKIRELMQ